jgi:biopolymer transport protein ExbB/TolQ
VTGAAVFLVWLSFGLLGACMTAWLIRRTWKDREQTTLTTKLVVSVVAASALLGAAGTLLGLVKVFGAIGGESVDPSQKARILANGIAEGMNSTALGLAVWVPSVIVAFVIVRARKGKAERK